MIVFRAADGRTITLEDLKGVSGTIPWELVGAENVPSEASRLHQQAREAGGTGNYRQALTLLTRAAGLAPRWPYPVYDRAYTHLLMQEFKAAQADYAKTVELAPRGFFTAITAVDILVREQRGEFRPGAYLAYLSTEWLDDESMKVKTLRQIVELWPRFAPAWKALSEYSKDDAERLATIEKGLASAPDAETRGLLQINQALILSRSSEQERAVGMLGELILDPASTLATELMAKVCLASLVAP